MDLAKILEAINSLARRIRRLEIRPLNPSGASGTFTTVDGKTITVVNGIVTSIV